jgi:hypothetical protein
MPTQLHTLLHRSFEAFILELLLPDFPLLEGDLPPLARHEEDVLHLPAELSEHSEILDGQTSELLIRNSMDVYDPCELRTSRISEHRSQIPENNDTMS